VHQVQVEMEPEVVLLVLLEAPVLQFRLLELLRIMRAAVVVAAGRLHPLVAPVVQAVAVVVVDLLELREVQELQTQAVAVDLAQHLVLQVGQVVQV
jgi:hypothetical protein